MHHRMGSERMCALKIPGLSRDRSGKTPARHPVYYDGLSVHSFPLHSLRRITQVSFDPDLEEVHQKLDALRNQPIERIMKTNPPTVSSETSYLACATILLQIQEHVRILPVVESEVLVGLIAPWDLIKPIETTGF